VILQAVRKKKRRKKRGKKVPSSPTTVASLEWYVVCWTIENKYTQNTYVLVNIPHYTVANHIKTIKTHAFFSKNKKYD
tara:strand:- start:229 stop:462 length:234 start_codon:yes stop_codon:yes gene_type:complete